MWISGPAIVTGSDSGIGQASALRLADVGADIVVHYRSDSDGAAETARGVRERGRQAIVVQADVSREDEVDALFEQAGELGAAHVLVNNAGVNAAGLSLIDMDTETFDRAIKTDLYGPFFCSRAFLRARADAGAGGVIVNVSSVHEDIPMPGGAEYCAAKGGLRMFTRTVALEAAALGVRVVAVAPGMVLTEMNQEAVDDPGTRAESERNIPLRRAGQAAEIANVVAFLASDEASYVTGATYTVDGGLTYNTGQGA